MKTNNSLTPPARWILIIISQVILLAAAFMSGFALKDWLGQRQFDILNQAYEILRENSIKDLPDEQDLEYGMIRGMLQAFDDPYTVFLEPPQHELETGRLHGSFGGIGARVEIDSEGFPHLYPYPLSPAEAIGIQAGDQLIQVDDWLIPAGASLDEIEAALRGPIQTTVRLVISGSSYLEQREIELVRSEIAAPSVTFHPTLEDPRVGVVKVSLISAATAQEVTDAVNALLASGVTHFILDLRNNSGGLVDGGVETARLFLKSGDVISQQYRGKNEETFGVNQSGPFADLPLVVLVNHGTASSAEIVAGALQKQGRALLAGSPTYGKDSIQLIFNLKDGSSLHVTAARWWVPGLSFPNGEVGLMPEILIEGDEGDEVHWRMTAIEAVLSIPAALQAGK